MAEINNFEFIKSKFPVLIALLLFMSLSLGLHFFVPEYAYCCGDMCPAQNQNPILANSINERLDIISNQLHSIYFNIAYISSILTLMFLTLNMNIAMKKIFHMFAFDWTLMIVVLMTFSRCVFYVNVISGFVFGGCI